MYVQRRLCSEINETTLFRFMLRALRVKEDFSRLTVESVEKGCVISASGRLIDELRIKSDFTVL